MTLDMGHMLTVILVLLCSSGLQAEEIHKEEDLSRLVGRSSRCSGTLEVKHDGDWRPAYNPYWTVEDAAQICRKLDCGSVVTLEHKEAPSHTANAWRIDSFCGLFTGSLSNCLRRDILTKRLEISCRGSVRLVNGTSSCSGRLEVKSNQQWSSVCEDDFDQQDAEVVCRELDCGAPSVLQGALYGEAETPMGTKEFQCRGNESALPDCRSSDSVRNTCSPGKAVGLTCADFFMLVGGSSRCFGTLEVKHDGDWRPVYNPDWRVEEAAWICRKLDCGSVVTLADKEAPSHTANAWKINSFCVTSTASRRNCLRPDNSTKRLEISCHESVRLVNGTSSCSGRLEVKSNQQWSSVCEHDFDQQDAEVVCRELGCGTPSVLQGALYGKVEAPMWTKEFQCGGNESALLDCRSSDSARNACSPGKAVGLTCSEPVRLVGGSNRCNGRLELNPLKEWRPVFENHWSLKEAALVCRELDCGSAVSIGWRNTSSDRPTWLITSDCIKHGSTLTDCAHSETSSYNLEITCSDSVRLVNGNHCSGRLEVKSNQQWSSVCEDDFDQKDAGEICRELGCGAPSVLQGGLYGEAEAPISTKEIRCGGHECAFLGSRSSVMARNTCSPGKAVGLTCSEPVRLVGGSSRCNGRLEVKQGEWRPVFGSDSDWTLKEASVMCRNLDCGSVVSIEWKKESPVRPAWAMTPKCVHSRSGLMDCVKQGSSHSIMEITCSDSVRLVNGTSLCSGRLEVKSNQQWSSVCETDFDQQDAEVVCRELGCGAPLDFQGALYGELEAPMWTKEFQCGGNESALLDCRSSDSARNTCSPGKAVGLTCSAPVRLVGGSSHCSGILEMKHDKEWRPVFHRWTKEEPAVLCRDLDCGPFVFRDWRSAKSSIPMWKMSSDCVHPASTLRDCVKSGFFRYTTQLFCSEPVRLGGEHAHCNGTVEVKHGDWRPASASDWTLEDAAVFCKMLDCGSAVSTGWKKESSVRPVWALTSECVRSGSAVRDCVRPDSDSSILEIACSGRPYRLVEGSSRCSGILEVKHEEEWRLASSFDAYSEDVGVLCRKMRCDPNASVDNREYDSLKSTWEISFRCVQSGSPLKECIKPYSTSYILEITCSDEE